jgi:hypothetical protein
MKLVSVSLAFSFLEASSAIPKVMPPPHPLTVPPTHAAETMHDITFMHKSANAYSKAVRHNERTQD